MVGKWLAMAIIQYVGSTLVSLLLGTVGWTGVFVPVADSVVAAAVALVAVVLVFLAVPVSLVVVLVGFAAAPRSLADLAGAAACSYA